MLLLPGQQRAKHRPYAFRSCLLLSEDRALKMFHSVTVNINLLTGFVWPGIYAQHGLPLRVGLLESRLTLICANLRLKVNRGFHPAR